MVRLFNVSLSVTTAKGVSSCRKGSFTSKQRRWHLVGPRLSFPSDNRRHARDFNLHSNEIADLIRSEPVTKDVKVKHDHKCATEGAETFLSSVLGPKWNLMVWRATTNRLLTTSLCHRKFLLFHQGLNPSNNTSKGNTLGPKSCNPLSYLSSISTRKQVSRIFFELSLCSTSLTLF